MSNFFDKFFKSKNSNHEKRIEPKNYENVIDAYKKGCSFADNEQFEEALKYFDIAINCGIEEAYQERGLCAINDFNKAIALMPEDCNLYFCRRLR